jgi:hypothetical protein
MSSRFSRRRVARLGAGLVSIFLALAAAGMVNADTGTSSAINVTHNGLSVTVSGTWTWASQGTRTQLHYAGYAIDWGDVTSGNQLGSYHIGDGTPATNVVLQPTNPDRGTSGTWGSVSHTYAKAGTYTVCVIMYDIGAVKPFKTTGYHSLQASGPGHNTDNAVDFGSPGATCGTFDVVPNAPSPTAVPTAAPTTAPSTAPTPFQSFQGETFVPVASSTPPPTATIGQSTRPGDGGPMLPILLLTFSGIFGVIALTPVKRARAASRVRSGR